MAKPLVGVQGQRPVRQLPPGHVARTVVLLVVLVVVAGPSLLAIATALEPSRLAIQGTPHWLFVPSLHNFEDLVRDYPLGKAFFNSVVSSALAAAIGLAAGLPAAYALSRAEVRGRTSIAASLLTSRALPAIGVAIPFFLLFTDWHLIDTVWALVIVYLPYNTALVVWFMQTYFANVPRELDEAAWVDGASRVRVFATVVLPVARPGVIASGIYAFLFGWNNFFYPLILTQRNAETIPVLLTQFIGEYSVNWGAVMAGVVVLSIPMLVAAFGLRRYMVAGLAQGALR